MDDSGSPNSIPVNSHFTLSEIVEMENIYDDIGDESLDHEFCQNLAAKFSSSLSRTGKSDAITREQVQDWFNDKHDMLHSQSSESSLADEKSIVELSGSVIMNNEYESFGKPKEGKIWKSAAILRNDKLKEPKFPEQPKEETNWKSFKFLSNDKPNMSERINGLHEVEFEARSAKDYAWYDVASFLTYRINNLGDPEVRVRFSDFGKEEDEWVNVRDEVRERSIPLEPSECQKVKVGDLVLCFQDRENHALYTDANVVEIKRRIHDMTECTCRFTVCYEYDYSKEEVQLRRMCCRPEGSKPSGEIIVENKKEISVEDKKETSGMDEKWKMSFLY